MRAKGIIRRVERARDRVRKSVNAKTNSASKIAMGLAMEGYDGGYIDALNDVLLALYGNTPNRFGWWDEEQT